MATEQKEIKVSVLKQQIEDGMKKKELAAFYGIPVTQMTKVLKTLGLSIRKFRNPLYVIVDDTKQSTGEVEEKVGQTCEEAGEAKEEIANLDNSSSSESEANQVTDTQEVVTEEATEEVKDTLGDIFPGM